MPLLTLGIGSNIEPEKHIRLASAALREVFPGLECSRVFESEAVGFEGDNFLNLVAAVETELPLEDIVVRLKRLENELGRDRSQPRFSGRVIDVDILTYGQACGEVAGLELPRAEILENAFVLQPLAELLPEARHPLTGRRYASHWADYDKGSQALWPADFSC